MSLRKQLLQKSEEALETVKLPFKLKKEKKELESWVLDKEEEEATLELEIQELKGNKNLNVDTILDKIDELALVKRRLKQGNELMKELFLNKIEEEKN